MAKNTHIIEVKTIGSKNAIKAVAAVTAALYAFAKAVGIATDLAKQSAKVDALERGFDALGSKIGFTSGSLDKLRGAVDGTVNDMNLMKSANNAMMLGVVKSDEEMAQLFDTAQRLGHALGVETTDAVNSLVTGMGRQSILMLDNLGIIVDTETAYKNYAEKLGITTSKLDDLQKKEAFNAEVLRISSDMVGELGDEVLDGVTAFAQLETSIFNARTAIGEALSPVMQSLASFFGMAADKVAEFMRNLTEEDLESTVREMKALGMETTEYEKALNKIDQADLISKMAGQYEHILEPLDLITRSMEEQEALLIEEGQLNLDAIALKEKVKAFDEEHKEAIGDVISFKTEEFELGQKAMQNETLRILRKRQQIEIDKESVALTISIAENQMTNQMELNRLKAEEVELNKTNFNMLDSYSDKTDEILDKEKAGAKTRAKILKQGEKAQDRLQSKLESSSEAKQAEDIREAYRAAAGAAVVGYNWGAGWGGPIAGAIAGAIAFTAASVLAAKVQEFATGGDFVTNGPQLMMVGDNPSGKERVQVTPLGGDPNINGPQGGGITLNISNPIMSDDFVESEIIPKIREGIRLGGNLGV